MRRTSKEQREFARAMTAKQWSTLRALTMCHFYLSAAERGDPELYELFRRKLVIGNTGSLFGEFELPIWTATDAGKSLVAMHDAGKL